MNQINRKSNLIEIYALLGIDLLSIAVSYILAYYARFHVIDFFGNTAHKMVVLCLFVSCILYTFFLEWNRGFVTRGYFVELIAITKYNAVLLIITAVLVFVLRQGEFFSRLVFGYFALFNELIMFILHAVAKKILRNYLRSDYSKIPVMVVAEKDGIELVVKRLKSTLPLNYGVTSLVVWDEDMTGAEVEGVPVVASKETFIEMAKTMALDEVFINLPSESISTLKGMIRDIETMGAVCHYCLDIADWNSKDSTLQQFGNYTVISYAINNLDARRMIIKRFTDIIGAIIGLLITMVATPFVALAIKLDSPGPVFFAQTRIGKNGRRFKCYKFRSMYVDAELRKKELMENNEMSGLMFKMEDDPRVTRVGKFIRKTSIDELPQFYNILIGDMSMVGTRPPTEDEFDKYSLYYRRRLCMTPGLTGLWQVSGRSSITDFDEVVKLDLEYIDNWSLTLDLKILLQTIGAVFAGNGAK